MDSIIQYWFKKARDAPKDYEFLVDCIEEEVTGGQDIIGQERKLIKQIRFKWHGESHIFTGDDMVYFLENFMIPAEMCRFDKPDGLFFHVEPIDNYEIYIYMPDKILFYDGHVGRHDLHVIPMLP